MCIGGLKWFNFAVLVFFSFALPFFCFAGYWICLCEICLSKGLDVVICRVLGQFETDCCYHHWCCEFDLLSHWRLYIIPSFTKKKRYEVVDKIKIFCPNPQVNPQVMQPPPITHYIRYIWYCALNKTNWEKNYYVWLLAQLHCALFYSCDFFNTILFFFSLFNYKNIMDMKGRQKKLQQKKEN
jgi:hypothetical protein